MWDFILDLIAKLRRSLKGRGISILTNPTSDNKKVEAIAFNADRGFWRHLRKALAKAGFNDGYGAVIVLQIFAGLFMKQSLRATYRAKASCNDGDTFSFEKGQKLAKARVRAKMLDQQYNFLVVLCDKLANFYNAVYDRGMEIGELACAADEHLEEVLEELHEPQGE